MSNNLHARVVHRDETVLQQRALLHRTPLIFDGNPGDLPEFRSRVLFPLAMVGLGKATGINDREAFLAARWLSAVFCFSILWLFAITSVRAPMSHAVLAQGLLAGFFVCSFNHPWEHPTDFPDAIVMVVGLWAAFRRRFGFALLVSCIGAANRESAAFVGIVWLFVTVVHLDKSAIRPIAQGVVLMVAAMVVTMILRRLFGLPESRLVNSVAENAVLPQFVEALRHPFMSWLMLLVAGCLPVIFVINSRWKAASMSARMLALAGFCIAAISVVVGNPSEIRVLTPAVTVLVCSMLFPLNEHISTQSRHREDTSERLARTSS